MKTWRDAARPIIAEIIKKFGTEDEMTIRKELNKVYPFGEKSYHPYKIWLDEIKAQLGKKKVLRRSGQADPNQLQLF